MTNGRPLFAVTPPGATPIFSDAMNIVRPASEVSLPPEQMNWAFNADGSACSWTGSDSDIGVLTAGLTALVTDDFSDAATRAQLAINLRHKDLFS